MRRIEFEKEQIEEICQRYKNGESLDKISNAYEVSRNVMARIFKENNIKIRTIQESNGKQIPENIAEKVIYNYCVLKKGLVPSGAPYGLTQYMVEKILKDYGVRKRTYTEAKDGLRKYTVNDDYFKSQSHNMAYILGLLAADGNIGKKENSINISLHQQDKEILEKINQEIQNTRPIKIYSKKDGADQAKLQVFSSSMKKDLAHYNIIPAKTFSLKEPSLLEKKYIISYIRGYFDGDGSIYKGTSPIWSIASATGQLLEWMRTFLAEEYGIINNGIYHTKLSNGTIMYKLQYSGKEKLEKLFNILYVSDSLFLQRKKEKFKSLLNQ